MSDDVTQICASHSVRDKKLVHQQYRLFRPVHTETERPRRCECELCGGGRLSPLTLCPSVFPPPAVCDFGAHAGADVQTQDIQPQPQGLPQDLPLPEMAEDGGTTR